MYADRDPIDNGMLFEDVLDVMLGTGGIDCPLTVVSNFFQINPDGTNPSNDAYTTAIANLNNMVVFQKSDVKRPGVSENATVANIKFEELFEWLATMFKVYPAIEGSTLRLEHVSYYESKPVGIDLTASLYARWIADKNKYTYKTDKLPRFEFFQWMDDANTSAKMRTGGLTYGQACSSEGEEVTNVAARVNTDLEGIISNPENFVDDGFVFINAFLLSGAYYAIEETIQGTAQIALNGHLSFRNLIPYYHRWYAYQTEVSGLGIIALTIESTRPVKEGEPISINGWCCSDFINFDPNSTATTEIGDGEITSIEFSVKNGRATFNLEY